MGDFIVFVELPVLKEVNPEVLVGVVQGDIVEKVEAVENFVIVRVRQGKSGGLTGLGGPVDMVEEKLVVIGLGPQDEAQVMPLQFADVRRVGGDPILGDDGLEMGMLPAALIFSEKIGDHFSSALPSLNCTSGKIICVKTAHCAYPNNTAQKSLRTVF